MGRHRCGCSPTRTLDETGIKLGPRLQTSGHIYGKSALLEARIVVLLSEANPKCYDTSDHHARLTWPLALFSDEAVAGGSSTGGCLVWCVLRVVLHIQREGTAVYPSSYPAVNHSMRSR